MGLDSKVYGELFSTCMIINGAVVFAKKLSDQELMDIYMQFTRDLFGRNIPHYRVVGIWHDYDDKHDKSLFRVNDIYGQSCIELSQKLKFLVPAENGGNDGNLGCFYGVAEDMTEFQQTSEDFRGFCRDWGMDNGKGADARTANVLCMPRELVGSLMVDTYHDEEEQIHEFTTSDVWYTQRSPFGVKFPKVLIPNKFISGLQDVTLGRATTFMFIKKGVGGLSYSEAQKIFNPRCEYIMPCDVTYDLSQFFVVRTPDPGDKALRLTYLENVDEFVLQGILQNYGKEWMQE